MCNEPLEEYPCQVHNMPDRFKTVEMCEKNNAQSTIHTRLCTRPTQDTWSVWWCSAQNIMVVEICTRLVCYQTTNKIMLWSSKTQVSKSKNKRRVNAHCLASTKMMGLVFSWGREKRDRKMVDINTGFFVSVDRIQKFFDQKELQIDVKDVFCHAIYG